MVVTARSDEGSLSREENARIAHEFRCAIEAFLPRVVRATLRIRRGGEFLARGNALVQVSASPGPAGIVRVEVHGAGVMSCTGAAIRRVADAVARRMTLERQRLLEYLFLVNGAADGWTAASRAIVGDLRRRRTPRRHQTIRRGTASRRREARVAA